MIDERGLITSLIDLRGRARGDRPGAAGNRLQLHRDSPNHWDAWDVDEYYRRTRDRARQRRHVRSSTTGDGPVRADRRGVRRLDDRAADRPARRARTRSTSSNEIDWHEQQKLLKLGFRLRRARRPVGARRPSSATSSGRRTPTPRGRTPGSRSAPTAGCTSASPATASRSPTTRPTATTSAGRTRERRRHHDDGPTVADPRPRATPTPTPTRACTPSRVPSARGPPSPTPSRRATGPTCRFGTVEGGRDVKPLVSISNPAIVPEAIKLAEDRSGDIVVRLYESLGGHAVGDLTADFDISAVTFTDLLERPMADAPINASTTVKLDLRPFEIVTVRLARA